MRIKLLKPKKCKVCSKEFTPFNSMQKACSPKCAIELVRNNSQKAREKAEMQRLRERKVKLKSRSEWLKEAQSVFNKFIRLRDKDEPCISCGRYHQGQWHAGHYRSVGACPELRFCELNVHKQCAPCNDHKSGNVIEYRINLVKKIGADKVEWLERQDHDPKKYTIEDCKEIIQYYKEQIKGMTDA
ncbi:protein NinG [Rodentibacter caecimuris]|uniref:Protein NinG n=1 Tax=Rodentibacter caecimuris TaxID=1796644 RepID=A0AAJ3K556_9PAST|nr:recombination protein NinG [Rodentibacter heylii]AOF54452.1 NinG recombination protein [Pasteurellaceae bacterium NI1060]MCQ9122752.1 recombination protein NinG [Rodentibacter heylii]OOF72364.1 protein NinG [Rodentibacter heylii]OOF73371.1 protein NinG [Rodentibacter heylii]OOF75739.1 protein NinG [Rodentibacter heylii]